MASRAFSHQLEQPRFLNWGGRLGGLAAFLAAGLLPILFDVFGVLPVLGMTNPDTVASERFPPVPGAGLTLTYLAVATFIYQGAVTPEARVDAVAGVVIVRGSVFTTTIPLAATESVGVGPGAPSVTAGGRTIPNYALMAPNLPEFRWNRRRRQRAFRDAVLNARAAQVPSGRPAAVTRSVTGLAAPQLAMVALDAAYIAWGFIASTTH